MENSKNNIIDLTKQKIATFSKDWFYFTELEGENQIQKRRCRTTGLVQRLEEQEVWVFITE